MNTKQHRKSNAVVWTIKDIAHCCAELHIDLSPDGHKRVLRLIERDRHACAGFDWSVIDRQFRELAAVRMRCS